jgi:hypothetical protein
LLGLIPVFKNVECHGLRQRSWKRAAFVTRDRIHAKYRAKWIEIALGVLPASSRQ